MKKIAITTKPLHPRVESWVKDRSAEETPMKRLTIDIPLVLHQQVKSQCALKGLNMADVLREMLEASFPVENRRLAEPAHENT
ncbi:MAG: hypothetical protein ACKO85_16770 [Isosphaeraceae bacterium]